MLIKQYKITIILFKGTSTSFKGESSLFTRLKLSHLSHLIPKEMNFLSKCQRRDDAEDGWREMSRTMDSFSLSWRRSVNKLFAHISAANDDFYGSI